MKHLIAAISVLFALAASAYAQQRTVTVNSGEERTYVVETLRITRFDYDPPYATIVVQGTNTNTKVQCAIRSKLSNEFIATTVWNRPNDIVTEIVLSVPEHPDASSVEAICFEVE